MGEAACIINVSELPHSHGNGLAGMWTVPARKPPEDFGLLVVYPTPEIQDIGSQKRTVHWLKARPLAMDIVGLRSDAAATGPGMLGSVAKWGIYLCEAEPDMPKALLKAIEEEGEFLNENLPDVRYVRKGTLMVAMNVMEPEVKQRKIDLSAAVVKERTAFERDCRKLVKKKEVEDATRAMLTEYGRLIAEGDAMWATPGLQRDINFLHRHACRTMGQERPWCYVPQQLVDCPGCGAKIKTGVITCSHCGAILDATDEEYRRMSPGEKARRLYPERYTEGQAPGSGRPEQRKGA